MSRNNAGLSRERIILEALHIIAGRGLGGLSMRRLGDALEVEAMAIYHHFPLGKEQLFNAITAYVASPAPQGTVPIDPADLAGGGGEEGETEDPAAAEAGDTRPWDVRLTEWAHAYRARLLEFSGALSLLVHRAPQTPSTAATRALLHRALTEAGLSGQDVQRGADAVHSYCVGAVVHQVRHQDEEDAPDEGEARARFDFGLRALLRGLV
ncbi:MULTISPECIES: TetR/AcrR family transcriptional regulator [unclassified Nocardiopsis]|uniref:TetR/AcrR family transcriptional regulator n=1 Tax=unclassified Nocardiopsis TaxID=2649073 RepID=UPI0013579208|nr:MULTISPECIES: TetR/AcrR family transcriptional regulator [unclassified Nocardiopsis]